MYESLFDYVRAVKEGGRRLENVVQSLLKMDLADRMMKHPGNDVNHPASSLYGKRVQGFMKYLQNMDKGWLRRESIFIVVGKSRSGKTFFTRALFDVYREHFSRPENMKYTFAFTNLERLGYGEKLNTVESQTFEDPMVLAMNLGVSQEESIGLLRRVFGLSEKDADDLLAKYRSWGGGADYFYWPSHYRPLGACSRFIWEQIKNFCGNIEKALDWARVVPVMPEPGKKLITFDYPKDRITSSAADIIGEESIERLVNLQCFDGRGGLAHPYAHDLQRGLVARAAGGGIHCYDEFLKMRRPVFYEYLRTIKRMGISMGSDLNNFWPIDTLFLATTNDLECEHRFPWRKLDESQTCYETVKYIDIPTC